MLPAIEDFESRKQYLDILARLVRGLFHGAVSEQSVSGNQMIDPAVGSENYIGCNQIGLLNFWRPAVINRRYCDFGPLFFNIDDMDFPAARSF